MDRGHYIHGPAVNPPGEGQGQTGFIGATGEQEDRRRIAQLCVIGEIEGRPVRVLVDTGAGKNLLCLRRLQSTYPDLVAYLWARRTEKQHVIMGAGGHESYTLGDIRVSMKIGNSVFMVDMQIVEECPFAVILGAPLLRVLNICIDMGNGYVTVGADPTRVHVLTGREAASRIVAPVTRREREAKCETEEEKKIEKR